MDKYYEKLSSKKTEWLFIALTALFLLLFVWRVSVNSWNSLAIVFLVLSCFFLFYSINYRILIIRITSDFLKLSFGIFTWTVRFDNIESCSLDEIPAFMKYGGAGIHFMNIRKRYRASFNFLEYPRVVIAFKRKVGLVREISFSTRRPEEVIRLLSFRRAERGEIFHAAEKDLSLRSR
jgi:Ca2+/Na+ antiporter